jgi:hypothetical protein
MASSMAHPARDGGLLGNRAGKSKTRSRQLLYPGFVLLLVVFSWLLAGKSSTTSPATPALQARDFKPAAPQPADNATVPIVGELKLLKRAGDPDTPSFADRIDTGRRLWCMMENPTVPQASWAAADLARWGWEELPIDAFQRTKFEDPVSAAYTGVGLSISNDQGYGYLHINEFIGTDGEEHEVSRCLTCCRIL